MKKLIFGTLTLACMFGMTGCMDYFPDDELNASVLMADPAGAEYIMDGCYATLKDQTDYLGYESGNSYVRHYTQMAEFPGDNICLAGKTTDPLYEAMSYTMTDNLKNVGALWWLAYKVIYMSNTVIENNEPGSAADQYLGEAYYMRALMHLHLVTLYAKAYALNPSAPGVPLRVASSSATTTRATVAEVYAQIVADLQQAAKLMGPSRGNAGYPSHNAALGLLTRVYLYMGDYDNVIKTTDEMLAGADPASKLDDNIGTYFANAKTSKETLFCIAHELTDDKGQASAGSMYNADGGGWGEIYCSDPLLYLYERYPMDKRYTELIAPQYSTTNPTSWKVFFPDPATPDDKSGRQNLVFDATPDGDNFQFTEDKTTYTVERRSDVEGEPYYKYYVKNYGGETEIMARVVHPMLDRYNYPKYYVKKFGYQDGSPTLSSPVMQRWGEVILNAAEAYAQKNQNAKALEYVNVIRKRAGIPEETGMFSEANMHGYTSVLDVVLDERRLELAFEGHRPIDQYRNKRDMDRRYSGAHPWAIVPYTYEKIQYPIPNGEYTVSGIAQNPGY